MGADQDDAPLEARITHSGHRNQKLTCQIETHVTKMGVGPARLKGNVATPHHLSPECDFTPDAAGPISGHMLLRTLIALALTALPAAAQTASEVLQARLLPGWQMADGRRMAALALDLAPDWKTYWRSPGDAGIPPAFDWSGSKNLAGVRFHWPRPQVFDLNGMQSIGYKKHLVLPLELTPSDPSKPIRLNATIDLGVCNDICMPASVSVEAELSGTGQSDPLIKAALADQPIPADQAGANGISCEVSPSSDGLTITAHMSLPPLGGKETVVFEPGPVSVWVSDAAVTRKGSTLVASADMVSDSGAPIALDRRNLTVTVLGPDRAVEIRGCPAD